MNQTTRASLVHWMAWFDRDKPSLTPEEGGRRVRTEGLWLKCEHCGQIIWRKALEDNLQVCPKCEHHYRIDARSRLVLLFDDGRFEEFDKALVSTDPLSFVDSKTYKARLAAMQHSTDLRDAIISAAGHLNCSRKHICARGLNVIACRKATFVSTSIH